jgi:CRP-like cAMP-binding protein
MSTVTEILKQSTVFSSVGEDYYQRLEPLFIKRTIDPGDILATAGETAQSFFLLAGGTVLLAMEEGRSVVLNAPGDFIGLELLSVKGVYKTTVTVLEKGSVFVIPRQDFLPLIQEDSPEAAVIMGSWQDYLETTASFAKNIEDIRLPYNF